MHAAGYFTGVMGTGEHGRQLVAALRGQGIAVATTTLHPEGSPEDDELQRPADEPRRSDRFGDFNLLCANADAIPGVADQLGASFFTDRYTIGFWAWEVSVFPERFLPAFHYVDEVWVGSRHVRAAVAAIATVPVLVIPQPVSLAPDAARAQPPGGIPAGYRFLFAFDYLSVFQRKNPVGVIQAFARAFAPGAGAKLIVKSLNHDWDPHARDRVRDAARAHPDVHLIEDRLTRSERDGLMNAADCYVSLHRAEGFGYTLAEAMWLGKPVIATGYSGNLDFMTPENSYLVNYRLGPIGPGNDPYPADGNWAEPDLDHAAALMRRAAENRDEARRRGDRASSEIRASHGPEASGRAMVQRLELLAASQAGPEARGRSSAATSRAEELIRSGPVPPARARFGAPQRAGRKGLLRLLKPLVVHQRLVEGQLLEAIDALNHELRSLERSHRETLRRLDQLAAELGTLRDSDERDAGRDC